MDYPWVPRSNSDLSVFVPYKSRFAEGTWLTSPSTLKLTLERGTRVAPASGFGRSQMEDWIRDGAVGQQPNRIVLPLVLLGTECSGTMFAQTRPFIVEGEWLLPNHSSVRPSPHQRVRRIHCGPVQGRTAGEFRALFSLFREPGDLGALVY